MAKVLSSLRITQHYGHNGHKGTDLGATNDRKVFANAEGTVEAIQTGIPNDKGSTGTRSWGNYVLIKHPNGMKTRYAHLSQVLVKVGQHVSAGQQIGVQGNTGNSYGTHLHYEVYKNGTRINSEPYIEKPVYQTSQSGVTGEIVYKVYTYSKNSKINKWLGEVSSHEKGAYAGNKGYNVLGIKAKPKYGKIRIESHIKDGQWLSPVSSNKYYDNDKNSYSGTLASPIDMVKITCTQGSVSYEVYDNTKKKWLPQVKNGAIAGNKGNPIGAIRIK